METTPSREIRHTIANIETLLRRLSQEVDYWDDIERRDDEPNLKLARAMDDELEDRLIEKGV